MKFCENCGAQIPDGSAFCTNCGTVVKSAAPATGEETIAVNRVPSEYRAAQQPAQPYYYANTATPAPKNTVNGMVFPAIMLCWFPILGLIFSIIAKKRAGSGEYKVPLTPIAVVALVFSIIFTAFCAIFVAVLIIESIVNGSVPDIA